MSLLINDFFTNVALSEDEAVALHNGEYSTKETANANGWYECKPSCKYYPIDELNILRLYRYNSDTWFNSFISKEVCRYTDSYFQDEVNSHWYSITHRTNTHDGKEISDETFRLFYFRCYRCDEIYEIEERDESGYYCSNCIEGIMSDPAEWCKGVRSHSTNVIDALGINTASFSKHLLFGVELEHELAAKTRTEYRKSVRKIDKLLNSDGYNVVMKYDGSLTCGVEVCTAPLPLNEHLSLFSNYFREMKEDFGTFHNSVGMHVHINKGAMSKLHQGKLLRFMNNPKNLDFILAIAGRINTQYAKFMEHVRVKDINKLTSRGNRYVAVNNCPNTLEIRIFKSPKSFKLFAVRMQFVNALVDFTRNMSIKDENLDVKYFLPYIMESKYKILKQFVVAAID